MKTAEKKISIVDPVNNREWIGFMVRSHACYPNSPRFSVVTESVSVDFDRPVNPGKAGTRLKKGGKRFQLKRKWGLKTGAAFNLNGQCSYPIGSKIKIADKDMEKFFSFHESVIVPDKLQDGEWIRWYRRNKPERLA